MQPLGTCNRDDVPQNNPSITSACSSPSPEAAFTCHDNVPWSVNSTHAYGFAAVPANGDVCGTCHELTFTGEGRHGPNDGAAALSGKVMIVQATNIGHDVAQEQFDIMIPGGGVGALDACTYQWGVSTDQLGAQFGGFLTTCQQQHGHNANHATYKSCVRERCSEVFGDNSQLAELLAGCNFFVDWYEVADNPTLTYRTVSCPSELVQISGMSRTPLTTTGRFLQPLTTTSTTTTLPASCSGSGVDRWGPDLGGCCSGLAECHEPRPESDSHYCMVTDPGHGSRCWSTVQMCRSECTAHTTTSTTTTLSASCSGSGVDRWGPDLGGCCSGLAECNEPRPESDSHYCRVADPGHGSRCWSTVQMCRGECTVN